MRSNWLLDPVYKHDTATRAAVAKLCQQSGLRLDEHLDLLLALKDEAGVVRAAGGARAQTIRCLVVDEAYRGENLLPLILEQLLQQLRQAGYKRYHIYSKLENAPIFTSLGFSEIVRTPTGMVFMERPAHSFAQWLRSCEYHGSAVNGSGLPISAIVMNANPMSLGHLYLLEKARQASSLTHVFVLEDDLSDFSFAARFAIVRETVQAMPDVALHSSGAYLVSQAVFPSYFLKCVEEASREQVRLDCQIFLAVAQHLQISQRFMGSEEYSEVTQILNEEADSLLSAAQLKLCEVPRLQLYSEPVSASRIRALLRQGQIAAAANLAVPAARPYLAELARTIQISTEEERA